MKITISVLNRLTRFESFQFLSYFNSFAESHSEGMPDMYTNKLAEFQTALEVFDEALVQEKRTSPEGLLQSEENRDYAVRKIHSIINEYSDCKFDQDKESAARKLQSVFKLYGTGYEIAAMAQDLETGVLHNLIQDLSKEGAAEHIVTLGLTEGLATLELNNNKFQNAQETRIKDDGKFVAGVVKTARVDAQNQFMALIDIINALSIVEGPEKYAELKDTVNALIKKYVTRTAQRTKKKEEENPEEIIE